MRRIWGRHPRSLNEAVSELAIGMIIRAVIFDFDGVLADTLEAHLNYCRELAEEHSLGLSIPDPGEFKARIVQSGLTISPMLEFFRALGFPDELASRCAEQYQQNFHKRKLPLFDGVISMLKNLSICNGVVLGIVTSNVRNVVESVMGENLALFHPGCIRAKDPHGEQNKAKDIEAIRQLLGLEASEVIYVGDQEADRQAAQAAGVRFLGVSFGWGFLPQSTGVATADSIDELERLIRIMSDHNSDIELLKISHDHGKSLFVYHAGQRHASIRFYLAAFAALVAGFLALVTSTSPTVVENTRDIGIGLGVFGVLISICFWALDTRNAKLVDVDEKLVEEVEEELKKLTPFAAIETIQASNKVSWKIGQYKWIMRFVFFSFILLSFGAIFYSVFLPKAKIESDYFPIYVVDAGEKVASQDEIVSLATYALPFREASCQRADDQGRWEGTVPESSYPAFLESLGKFLTNCAKKANRPAVVRVTGFSSSSHASNYQFCDGAANPEQANMYIANRRAAETARLLGGMAGPALVIETVEWSDFAEMQKSQKFNDRMPDGSFSDGRGILTRRAEIEIVSAPGCDARQSVTPD